MNKVFLNGYLAQDPKQRITAKGMEQSSFSLGVTDLRNYNESYFFQCVAWGQQAKYINNNLKKGSFVAIDGRLTRRSYVDGEGKNVYVTEIIVDNIKHFGLGNKSNSSNQASTGSDPIAIPDQPETMIATSIDEVLNDTNNNQNGSKTFDWEKDLD